MSDHDDRNTLLRREVRLADSLTSEERAQLIREYETARNEYMRQRDEEQRELEKALADTEMKSQMINQMRSIHQVQADQQAKVMAMGARQEGKDIYKHLIEEIKLLRERQIVLEKKVDNREKQLEQKEIIIEEKKANMNMVKKTARDLVKANKALKAENRELRAAAKRHFKSESGLTKGIEL